MVHFATNPAIAGDALRAARAEHRIHLVLVVARLCLVSLVCVSPARPLRAAIVRGLRSSYLVGGTGAQPSPTPLPHSDGQCRRPVVMQYE